MRMLVLWFFVMAASMGLATDAELWEAAEKGDLAAVRTMVEGGADVAAKNRYGQTALFLAVIRGHLDVAAYLIEKGSDGRLRDSFYGMSMMGAALQQDTVDMALLLAENFPDIDSQAGILNQAVDQKDREGVSRALKLEVITAEHIESALAAAREGEATEIVAVLEKANKPSQYDALGVKAGDYQAWSGPFNNQNINREITIATAGKKLTLAFDDNSPQTLLPKKEGDFAIIGRSNLTVSFREIEGTKQVVIIAGGTEYPFPPGPLPKPEEGQAAAPAQSDALAAKPAPLTPTATVKIPRRKSVNWPSFRGPRASGVADGQGVPVSWDATSGENIKWKTPIPGYATASPVVWGNRVFLVTAVSGKGDDSVRTGLYGDVASVDDESVHKFIVYGLDKNNGKILWERTVAEEAPKIKRHTKSSQANSTPVTDGKHVVSVFGTIGLMICHDLDGKELWRTDLGPLDNGWFFDKSMQWGHSSSPVIHEDRVIIQVDVQKDSYIAAFSLANGKQLWKTSRKDEIPTWGTPTVSAGSKPEIITNGTTIRGYDPKTGKELWTLGPMSEIAVATPILHKDLFFVTGGYPPVRPVYAIKAGSKGDLTLAEGAESSAAIPWMKNKGGTYMPTPIVYDGYLYTCANDGRVICYKADTGEQVYRARISGRPSFTASPVASDGRLYFPAEEGIVHVIQAGPTFKELVKNEMGEVIQATPAISGGVMLVRTHKHIFGVADLQTN